MASLPESDPIADLLKRSRTIAVVGLSNSPLRPSHGVSAYMQTQGYRIIPVNPNINGSLGEKAYPSLLEVPEKIDIVNIFRRPEFVEEAVDQSIRLKVPVIWMQEGVVHEKAAQKARAGELSSPLSQSFASRCFQISVHWFWAAFAPGRGSALRRAGEAQAPTCFMLETAFTP